MSVSDEGNRFSPKLTAAIIALSLGCVTIGGIFFGLYQQFSYAGEADQQIRIIDRHNAQKANRECAIVLKEKMENCINIKQDEHDQDTKGERHDLADLVAQRTSALWTAIMGIAALIGMTLSAAGIALVYITFREQRRTNDLAQADAAGARKEAQEALAIATRNANAAESQMKTAQAAQRAWLSIDVKSRDATLNELGLRVTFDVFIKNVGATVARNLTISSRITNDAINQYNETIDELQLANPPEDLHYFLAPGDVLHMVSDEFFTGENEIGWTPSNRSGEPPYVASAMFILVHYRVEFESDWKRIITGFVPSIRGYGRRVPKIVLGDLNDRDLVVEKRAHVAT